MHELHFMRTYLLSYAFLVTMSLPDYRRNIQKIIIMYNDIVNKTMIYLFVFFNN